MNPNVCVLIPCFQNQDGLQRTCESLVQAEGTFDILIVDDGSPVPLRIPECLAGVRHVTMLRSRVNEGITAALNAGLALIFPSDYQYVARLDTGDLIHPSRFRLQSELLDTYPSICLVGSYIDFHDPSGLPLFRFKAPETHRKIMRRMHIENCLVHSGSMLRASAVRTAGGYRPDCTVTEDYDLFLRMLREGEAAVIPQALTMCEHNLQGISVVRRRKQQRERLRLQFRFFDKTELASYYGVVRTLVAMHVSQSLVVKAKEILLGKHNLTRPSVAFGRNA